MPTKATGAMTKNGVSPVRMPADRTRGRAVSRQPLVQRDRQKRENRRPAEGRPQRLEHLQQRAAENGRGDDDERAAVEG